METKRVKLIYELVVDLDLEYLEEDERDGVTSGNMSDIWNVAVDYDNSCEAELVDIEEV